MNGRKNIKKHKYIYIYIYIILLFLRSALLQLSSKCKKSQFLQVSVLLCYHKMECKTVQAYTGGPVACLAADASSVKLSKVQ